MRFAMTLRSSSLAAALGPRMSSRMMVTQPSVTEIASWKAHGGYWKRFEHASLTTGCTMKFSSFIPPGATPDSPVPVLFYLSGLTCTDENVVQKCGASRAAALHNVALICPDTSPRGKGVPGEDDNWDFGTGAGFYIDATKSPWDASGYNMYSYVTSELRDLIRTGSFASFLDGDRVSITGHSMGGHGALTIALKDPGAWTSVSAFAPICHPTNCPWGTKAFSGYLAGGTKEGEMHDAVALLRQASNAGNSVSVRALRELPILVDQGSADTFLSPSKSNGPEGQLQPEALQVALSNIDHPDATTNVRIQDGYDHSYFFMATFIDEHIGWHAKYLKET